MLWLMSRLTSLLKEVTFWLSVQLKLSHPRVYPHVRVVVGNSSGMTP